MSAYLDLDDVVAGHPEAKKELASLRAELAAAKAAGMREAAKMVEEKGYSYVAGEILKAADKVEAGE